MRKKKTEDKTKEQVVEPTEDNPVEDTIVEVVEKRSHEGKIVASSKKYVLNKHNVEHLFFEDGSETILPA